MKRDKIIGFVLLPIVVGIILAVSYIYNQKLHLKNIKS